MSELEVVEERAERRPLIGALILIFGVARYPVFVIWLSCRWLPQRLSDALNKRRQRARLSASLAGLEPGDMRRVEVTQRFWLEEQARAVSALRERFAGEPAPLSLSAALSQSVRHNRAALRVVAVGVVTLCAAGFGLMLLFQRWEFSIFLFVDCIALAFLCAVGAMLTLGVEGVMLTQHRASQRRVFTTERRRIATMAELAGGLTLIDGTADDALVGALSPDGAQGGALSEVEP
jgi:hypothetical protein